MALIKCPECKKKISDTVSSCPQCGYSITPDLVRKIKQDNLIKKSVGTAFLTLILLIAGFILYFYLTLKPSLIFGNECKNDIITNETYTFNRYDSFYYSLETYKPIGTTKVQMRLSLVTKDGSMTSPYQTYDLDINPDWSGLKSQCGIHIVNYIFLIKHGNINIAFVANNKLLAQKEITIIDQPRKVKATSNTGTSDMGLPADEPGLPDGDMKASPDDASPPLP